MKRRALISLLLALMATGAAFAQERLSWQSLPALPNTPGFGGPFVGSHAGYLIVAGGANFPEAPPWQGGKKVWYDHVLVLDPGATTWRQDRKLKALRAYGAAISTNYGMAMLGGSDADRHYTNCQLLLVDANTGRTRIETLPPLPTATAFPAAAASGDTIYVAAGSDGSDPTAMTHAFWSLDLATEPRTWSVLPTWPGPARHKAVGFFQSNGSNGCFYLFSGEIPKRAADGTLSYDYRTDGYRYDPQLGTWQQLNELQVPSQLRAQCQSANRTHSCSAGQPADTSAIRTPSLSSRASFAATTASPTPGPTLARCRTGWSPRARCYTTARSSLPPEK